LVDVARHARIWTASLPGLERANDRARHEHPASLTGRVCVRRKNSMADEQAVRYVNGFSGWLKIELANKEQGSVAERIYR
jgi:hypothetical protein